MRLAIDGGVVEDCWEGDERLNLLSKLLARAGNGSVCHVQQGDPQHVEANPPETVPSIDFIIVLQVEIHLTCVCCASF